jgi:hypothetical protein
MVRTYDFVSVSCGMDSDHKMIQSTTNGVPDDDGFRRYGTNLNDDCG